MADRRMSWMLWAAAGAFGAVCVPVLIPVALVFVALNWVCDKLTGHDRWCCERIRRMIEDRDPVPDADFLAAVSAAADDAPVWVAVRDKFAEHIGVPPTAIRPDDEVGPLLLLMEPWGGLLEVVSGLERLFGVKIDRRPVEDRLLAAAVPLETAPFAMLAAEFVREVAAARPRRR